MPRPLTGKIMSLEFNRRRPMRRSLSYLFVAGHRGPHHERRRRAEPPALQGVSAQEKARLTTLIDAAKQEGALTYWDVVIQPETNDALAAEFRKTYGLPGSFQVNYQLSATANLVTASSRRSRQPRHHRHRGDRLALLGVERANKGDALEYDSPQ